MGAPVLHLLAGPNGSGKTTLFEHVLGPATLLPFINADRLARERWPGEEEAHGHDASRLAAEVRAAALAARRSFVSETVFSHRSKVELVDEAREQGYRVHIHVVIVPEELSVMRVALRVRNGGHAVPEAKVRERYRRLWPLVREALDIAQEGTVYDNGSARRPFRVAARYVNGIVLDGASWPAWSPLS